MKNVESEERLRASRDSFRELYIETDRKLLEMEQENERLADALIRADKMLRRVLIWFVRGFGEPGKDRGWSYFLPDLENDRSLEDLEVLAEPAKGGKKIFVIRGEKDKEA